MRKGYLASRDRVCTVAAADMFLSTPQEALPYKSKPKVPSKQTRKGYLASRAVAMDPSERKAAALYASLAAVRNEKAAKRREQKTRRRGVRVKISLCFTQWRII